jgi:hypothetical protein
MCESNAIEIVQSIEVPYASPTNSFDHVIFIRQTNWTDGIYHLQHGVVPAHVLLVIFDEDQFTSKAVVDFGQEITSSCYVTSLTDLEKSWLPLRILVIRKADVVEHWDPGVYINWFDLQCRSETQFSFLGVPMTFMQRKNIEAKRTVHVADVYENVLDHITCNMPAALQIALNEAINTVITELSSFPCREPIFSRRFTQFIGECLENYLSLTFIIVMYLVEMRVLVPIYCWEPSKELCDQSEDEVVTIWSKLGIAYYVHPLYLDVCYKGVMDPSRLRIASLPPLPNEELYTFSVAGEPSLPPGDVIEEPMRCIVRKYPTYESASTNCVSLLNQFVQQQ